MLLLSMMLGMFSTSCQDMLSPNSERHAYTVAEDTLYSYWGILKSLQNIAERYVILNECRGDLVDASGYISDTIAAIVNFGEVDNPETWEDGACAYLNISDYYHIINSCNAYIAMCDTTRTTGTNQKYMLKEYAQVQSIRAWVYMQLLYAYGENRVPFYKEPMLTTKDIDEFIADKSHPLLTAQLLEQELAPELETMEPVEVRLANETDDQQMYDYQGMPDYNNYGDVNNGNSHFVCHSSKCLFPISIVLGDLYLLSGNYTRAAQHYYNYINTQNCGPLAVDKCYSRGILDSKLDYPIYSYDAGSVPYTEKNAVSRSTETITCIPSNKGKLEGKVLTDINRLFGFEASMRTSGNESGGASVGLSRNYERELLPSKGYEALCDSQKYEIYVGEPTSDNTLDWGKAVTLEVLEGVGDARRAWIYAKEGRQWEFRVGDDDFYGKMVAKQNPGGSFSTTYPVIYRKSTVWLRYAEALNRAGFPSYAFAILKTGLCNNRDWFPQDPSAMLEEVESSTGSPYLYMRTGTDVSVYFDYNITDSVFVYQFINEEGQSVILPGVEEGMSSREELLAWVENYFQQEFEAYQEAYQASLDTEEPLPPMDEPREVDPSRVYWAPKDVNSFGSPIANGAACYYIALPELRRAANTPYLDFKQTYLRGQNQTQLIYSKDRTKMLTSSTMQERWPSGQTNSEYTYTIGVHQRGCGFILSDDPESYGRSSYNYVGLMQKKIKEATGKDVTEEDIYSGAYDEDIQNAVEDLIIDEAALELAFEGSRFSDLCRVALRRNDPNFLAERVAKRHTGEVDGNLQSWLQDKSHWFLPIPKE